ncbi:hypothetical protein [Pseudanabaena mucicola]|uniref:RlpA-like protein double-psi beta-barrel domain-containing protein n=1 Tax=Pseudanabaena mucicola FACHB-723 TaxID=2692860 RepID=A0ABR8A0M2_9CYAN|nr:hypothetical protein [Pseudanabaena mucicola]MBD2189767.1 hypothetical protein [Pseudanabaena mucicola FACHB-723]
MAAFPLFHGVGIDGKKYGFRASDTAYPSAILTTLGLTKVATNGTVPTDVLLLPDNQVKGFFVRIRVRLQNGKSLAKFAAANKAGALNALKGKTTNGSKVIDVKFTG